MRLKFYGLNDYGTFFQAERAVTVLAGFDQSRASYDVNDIVELHNASLFVEHGVFPTSMVQAERDRLVAGVGRSPGRGRVLQYANGVNVRGCYLGCHYSYRSDALAFLAKFKVFDLCSATIVLDALKADRFHHGDVLSCRALVRAYDEDVRSEHVA